MDRKEVFCKNCNEGIKSDIQVVCKDVNAILWRHPISKAWGEVVYTPSCEIINKNNDCKFFKQKGED